MNNTWLILITFLPPLIGCLLIYLFDKKKEPLRLIFKLFIYGILSVVMVIIITGILLVLFPNLNIDINNINNYYPIEIFIYTTVVVGFIEEGSKWIFTYLIGIKNSDFDETYDAVVYAIFVSLGFALLENVSYVINGDIEIAIIRSVSAVPAHLTFALFMGYFIGLSLSNPKKKIIFLILSGLVPILLHSGYDFILLCYGSNFGAVFFLIVFLIIGIICIVRLRKKVVKENIKIKYCARCGLIIDNEICSCGNNVILEENNYGK